jgi:hypothetical protein
MGETESDTSPHNVRCWARTNRSRSTRSLGQGEIAAEEGRLSEPRLNPQVVKITLEDALSLLGKYADEPTRVLAVFGTPSASIARVTGVIRVFADGRGPHLLVGKEEDTSDQIKFRLSDCVFEYGDFRDASPEDHGERKFEAFLVVGSSTGDTLSLEPRTADFNL